ncbi:MAG: DEAD/DEAH box helicase [Ilumatobacteraceae bacterium]
MADPSSRPPLLRHLPASGGAEAAVESFSAYVDELGLDLYPAQEEAILEVALGNHVILNTPTGSGKSMVATAAHFAALAEGRRSVYTAPIKALVSEKFFALCREFGSEQVGMVTGDAAVNPTAPIICCTQEILANRALRDGRRTPIDLAVVDEFHYYGDPQRGWAWQVPLLELPDTQFLLMSATLGDVGFFQRDLEQRTGRPTTIVRSARRPVPLEFEYRTSTLHSSVSDLLATGKAPIYLVHFTQKEATDAAQAYVSLDPLDAAEKERIKEALAGFRFDSPIGRDLRRFISAGIGVHHAGLLPKYRLLVEKLAQQGLLKIICGTDTLGVGVNVPIRSVLFTQLCKYDGTGVRILSNREFAQIAGRAGRKGFDDQGFVWVQAPEHVVDNLEAERKAAEKGRKKVVKKQQPDRGYAHWTEDTFHRLVEGQPEQLQSHFQVTHQMLMLLLDRPAAYLASDADPDGVRVDGCGAVKHLLTHNHEPRKRQRTHIRRAIAVYRSLVAADLLEFPAEPDELGRSVRVSFDLQDEFALHQPLSLWAVEAIGRLADAEAEAGVVGPELHALNVLSIVEAVQANPGVIIAAQVQRAKDRLMAEMKAAGVEYEERMERLSKVEHPKPNREWTYHDFDGFRARHPWVGSDNVQPKAIAREMYERAMTFGEYVQDYGLKRSEGVLLRYLSDVYKGLLQNVPGEHRTDDLDDIAAWLGAVVRQVDSSLIDEWERMLHPEDAAPATAVRPGGEERSIVDDERAFRVLVRNRMWDTLQRLVLGTVGDDPALRSLVEVWDGVRAGPGSELGELVLDATARSLFAFDRTTGVATQGLCDDDGATGWRITADVDLAGSAAEGRLVIGRFDLVGP